MHEGAGLDEIVPKILKVGVTKGVQPIQDQLSVLGADILNNPRNNYYGRSSNYSQRIQLSPKHQ